MRKKILWKNSLSFKLLVWFLIMSLLPLIIFSVQNYKHNSDKVKETVVEELLNTSALQKRYIKNWFNFRNADISSWSESFYTKNFLLELNKEFSKSNQEISSFIKTYSYTKIVDRYESEFVTLKKHYEYINDIFLIDKDGNIIYTISKGKDLGTNLLTGKYKSSNFANTYKQTFKDKKVHFSDLEHYEPAAFEVTGFLTTPLFDNKGSIIGVFGIQINLDSIFSIFDSKKGYSNYLVGLDGLLRTNISTEKRILDFKIDSEFLQHIIGVDKHTHYSAFNENESVSIHNKINIYGVEWILVNEISNVVLYENKKEFAITLFVFLLVISIFIFIIANYLSLQITKPIHTLIEAAVLISKGNYTKKIDIKTNDEIEQLSHSFNIMTSKLAFSQQEVKETTDELKEQKDSFESLYQKSTDGIFIIKNGKFIDCNESIIKMFGYNSKDKLLHLHPSKLSPEFQADGKKSFQKAKEMMQIALEKGSHSFEWMHIKSNGEKFWAEIVLTKMSQHSADIIHAVCRDVSMRKHIELELEGLRKNLESRVDNEVSKNAKQQQLLFNQTRLAQMGEMISMIAHQWRQPLGAISATSIDVSMKLDLEILDMKTEQTREETIKYLNVTT